MRLDIAVTATRRGLTSVQMECARINLSLHIPRRSIVLRHGMCEGGDTELHRIARELGVTRENGHCIEGHPGMGKTGQNPYHVASDVDVLHNLQYYLTRDDQMVDKCDVLWGFPGTAKEVVRGSGTWYTIRYARQVLRPLLIVYPNGDMRWENVPDELES